jgi:hypothetical protein
MSNKNNHFGSLVCKYSTISCAILISMDIRDIEKVQEKIYEHK